MELTSDAYRDGQRMPVEHVKPAIGGQDRSPPLRWSDPPQGTRSFALAMVDPHPVAHNWVHWLVVDLPADARELPLGASGQAMPPGSRELVNGFGEPGYGGPQPPAGTGQHPYVTTVYALSVDRLDVPGRASLQDFQRALQDKVLAEARLEGRYSQ